MQQAPAISSGSSSSDVSPNHNNSGDISKVSKMKASITEMFSPSRVCARCEQHGLVPGSSFDLRTGHDLSRYSVQREVEKAIDEEDPDLLIGSPPCTKFSILQNLARAKGLTDEQRERFDIELGQAVRQRQVFPPWASLDGHELAAALYAHYR